MSLSRRGKWTAVTSSVVVAAAVVVGVLVATGNAPAIIQNAVAKIGLAEPAPPPTCPLSGEEAPHGEIPQRPALAIKVENLPEARPQAGLDAADIVYEEPVEGGITRFIAVYQCHDAGRVGPVRSVRTTDADVLVQFGRPLLGFSGGARGVQKVIDRTGIVSLTEINSLHAFARDPNRTMPHDLFTGTKKLYTAAKSDDGAPEPLFVYGDLPEKSRRRNTIHLAFSSSSDVYWAWSRREGRWLRSHGELPSELETGEQVSAPNVVVQVVEVVASDRLDAAGNPSPEVKLTGGGKACVFRDGRMIVGRWERDALDDITRFVTKSGEEIALAQGTTWVELLPKAIPVETEK